jgi:5-formyltetrahydrofolate cyclo-ligase
MPHTSQLPEGSIDERKRALRVAMRERRCSMPAEERERSARAAQERLASSPLAAAARIIGVYASLPTEVSTDALVRALAADGKVVCYPAVRDDVRALDFREAGSGTFRLGALGVREPRGAPVELARIELFVVPAVAVDLDGRRLGRGRGHYDATLATAAPRALRVALVFDWQLVDEVPVDGRDERMDAVCTDSRLIRVQRGTAR